MENNKRIGVFGGSFNPIHSGHLIIAEYIREAAKLDKVIFIPVGTPSHREDNLLEANKRLELVEEAIKGNEYFEVSDIEVRANGMNYTYDTLLELKDIYKGAELYEIIGEDSADYLDKWKNYDKLIKLTKFLVFRREGFDYISKDKNIEVLNTPYIGISATEVRKRLEQGRSIRYLVPKEVEELIYKYSYYQK